MLQRARLLAFVILIAILTAFAILEVRLFFIQVINGDLHVEEARDYQTKTEELLAPRGRIIDCGDKVLCASIPCVDVYVATNELENPYTKIRSEKAETIEILSLLLGLDKERLRTRIDQNPGAYLCIRRKIIDQTTIDRFHQYKDGRKFLRGVHLEESYTRTYPQGRLLGHTVGWVDFDGRGEYGMEAAADSFLRGEKGSRLFRRDGIQQEIFCEASKMSRCRPGGDLKLTVDSTFQLFVEMELEKVEEKYDPNWAAAVVLEARTGRILASASIPAIDPGERSVGKPNRWTNNAFKEEYNPGSSFKPIMMALAMDAGVVDGNEQIDCENGRWRVGRRTVTDDHSYGLLSTSDVIAKSSNIGMSKIALRMVPDDAPRGSDSFAPILNHFRLMGLGRRTGVMRFSEESPGILTPLEKWSRTYTLVSVSFGYEVAVTPIQMAAAFLTLANGGVYIPPRLIDSYTDPDGNVIEAPRTPSCRVISERAALAVTRMLEKVVEEGTGKKAQIANCRVAGKTGTAQKDRDRSKHTASFIGFAPADRPAILTLVVVDEPKGSIYGGTVSAPAVGAILEKGLAHFGIRSDELVLADQRRGGDASR